MICLSRPMWVLAVAMAVEAAVTMGSSVVVPSVVVMQPDERGPWSAAFALFDHDMNGHLDQHEMARVAKTAPCPGFAAPYTLAYLLVNKCIPSAILEPMLAMPDLDHSGSLDYIEYVMMFNHWNDTDWFLALANTDPQILPPGYVFPPYLIPSLNCTELDRYHLVDPRTRKTQVEEAHWCMCLRHWLVRETKECSKPHCATFCREYDDVRNRTLTNVRQMPRLPAGKPTLSSRPFANVVQELKRRSSAVGARGNQQELKRQTSGDQPRAYGLWALAWLIVSSSVVFGLVLMWKVLRVPQAQQPTETRKARRKRLAAGSVAATPTNIPIAATDADRRPQQLEAPSSFFSSAGAADALAAFLAAFSSLASRAARLPTGASPPPLAATAAPPFAGAAPVASGMSTDEPECVVCMDRPQTHTLVPCGHMALCAPCYDEHIGSPPKPRATCPICRRAVSDFVRVYFSHERRGGWPRGAGTSTDGTAFTHASSHPSATWIVRQLVAGSGTMSLAIPGLVLGCTTRASATEVSVSAEMYAIAVLSQPFALLVHVVLVPPEATATPGIIQLAYWVMACIWFYNALIEMQHLETVPHDPVLLGISRLNLWLDLWRDALMALLTFAHGCLLKTHRARPWTAFRNLACMAPTITGACMLASLIGRSDWDVVYTPNGTPMAVALLRMGSCCFVCILSCMPHAWHPARAVH